MYIAVLRLGSGYRVDLIYKYVIRVSFYYNIGFFTKIYVFENRRECFGAKKKKKEGVLDPKIDFGVSVSIIGQKIIVKNKNGKIRKHHYFLTTTI